MDQMEVAREATEMQASAGKKSYIKPEMTENEPLERATTAVYYYTIYYYT